MLAQEAGLCFLTGSGTGFIPLELSFVAGFAVG